MSHHPNVEKLLSGTDWEIEPMYWQDYRTVEHKRVQDAYERTQAAWNKRSCNEGETNTQVQAFKPPYVKHEEVEQAGPSARAVLLGMGAALGGTVGFFVWLLANYR